MMVQLNQVKVSQRLPWVDGTEIAVHFVYADANLRECVYTASARVCDELLEAMVDVRSRFAQVCLLQDQKFHFFADTVEGECTATLHGSTLIASVRDWFFAQPKTQMALHT